MPFENPHAAPVDVIVAMKLMLQFILPVDGRIGLWLKLIVPGCEPKLVVNKIYTCPATAFAMSTYSIFEPEKEQSTAFKLLSIGHPFDTLVNGPYKAKSTSIGFPFVPICVNFKCIDPLVEIPKASQFALGVEPRHEYPPILAVPVKLV